MWSQLSSSELGREKESSLRSLADAVTVVVPTYNRATTLRETLYSLTAQTLRCRIVVVDDGSEDDTEAVCGRFAPQVEYVRHTDRVGLFANWNRAVAQARTEFVAVFHDDDIYEATIVERETRLLMDRPEMIMVHTGCRFIDDEGRESDRFKNAWPAEISGDAFRRALAGRFSCPIAAPSVMLRRDALAKIGGFDEHLRVSGDIAAWIALGALGTVGYIDEALVAIRVRGRHANSHAAPDWAILGEHMRVAESSQLEIHGSMSRAYRIRRDAYLLPFVLRELIASSGGEMGPVVRRYGSSPIRALANALPHLTSLAPILERSRPLARAGLVTRGRVRLRLRYQVHREKSWQARGERTDEATPDRQTKESG